MKSFTESYERRLRLIESNYGRDPGWHVERGGQRLAVLSDCRWEDMFWDSYFIEPVTEDPALNQHLLSGFWEGDEWSGIQYVNRAFPEVIVTDAFPGTRPFIEPNRLLIRGLYCKTLNCRPWEEALLWWGKRMR